MPARPENLFISNLAVPSRYRFLQAAIRYAIALSLGRTPQELDCVFGEMIDSIRVSEAEPEAAFGRHSLVQLLLAALVSAPVHFDQVACLVALSFPEQYRLVKCADPSGFQVRVLQAGKDGDRPTGSLLQLASEMIGQLDSTVHRMCQELADSYIPSIQERMICDLTSYVEFFVPSFSLRETSASAILVTRLTIRAHRDRVLRELKPNRERAIQMLAALDQSHLDQAPSEEDVTEAIQAFTGKTDLSEDRLAQMVHTLRMSTSDKLKNAWPAYLVRNPKLFSDNRPIRFLERPFQVPAQKHLRRGKTASKPATQRRSRRECLTPASIASLECDWRANKPVSPISSDRRWSNTGIAQRV